MEVRLYSVASFPRSVLFLWSVCASFLVSLAPGSVQTICYSVQTTCYSVLSDLVHLALCSVLLQHGIR